MLTQPILSLGMPPIDFVSEVVQESDDLTSEEQIIRNPNPDEEHVTVETVDPGSIEEKVDREMITSVDRVMTTEQAVEVEGIEPYALPLRLWLMAMRFPQTLPPISLRKSGTPVR